MATRKPDWAVKQIVRRDRPDRCVEDICQHGVGHPNKQWLKKQNNTYAGVHGCDGCCCDESLEQPPALRSVPSRTTDSAYATHEQSIEERIAWLEWAVAELWGKVRP